MTTSSEFVTFLSVRLDEDAGAARRAARHMGSPDWRQGETGDGRDMVAMGEHEVGLDSRIGAHIARHDPARTLREIEAKRAILGRCVQQAAKEHDNAMEEDRTWVLWPVLFDLAAVYSDHPDYRQEWKP